jgi:hypothetical protein
MGHKLLNEDPEKDARFTNGPLRDSKDLELGGRGKASQLAEQRSISNAHEEIINGLKEHQDLTTYMGKQKHIYGKGTRGETLLHCIAVAVGQDNLVDTGLSEPEDENQAYDETDSQEYGEEPYHEDIGKKRLFQWVVLRKPKLVRLPDNAKKNIIMFSLENRERIAVLFWLLEVVILDDSVRELEKGVCLKTETTPCNIPLDPALLDGFAEARRPSVNGSDSRLTHAKCFHEKVKSEPNVMEKLKSNSKELCRILVQVLGQKPFLFHAFIQEFEWDSSVKAFEKLVHLCCQEQKLLAQIPGNPGTPQQLNPLIYLDEMKEGLGTPLYLAVEKLRVSNAGDSRIPNFKGLIEMIKLLVRHCPQAIYPIYPLYKGRTPYQSLLDYKKESSSPEILDVEKYFKEVCIGDPDKTRPEKIKYLYPKGVEGKSNILGKALWHSFQTVEGFRSADSISERNIEFDMREETKVQINRDFLSRLKDMNQQYETVLAYIDLPPILPDSKMTSVPQEQQPSGAPTEAKPMTSYVHVFEWLKGENGVDKVFKVRVNDLGERPHKESDIRKALKDVEVDEWDWKKPDISSYTIIEAAKSVKILNLYWSGSNEVLQGWSCKHTLATLPKVSVPEDIPPMGFCITFC